jgi:hypothetical protein
MQIDSTTGSPIQAFDGDLGAQVAALAVQSDADTASVERRIQQSELDIAESESDRAIEAMHQKANDVRVQGVVDGCATMGEGALQAASAYSGGGGGGGGGAGGGSWAKSASTAVEGSDKLLDAYFAGKQGDDDANVKTASDAADRANQAAKDAHDAAGAARDASDKALDFYRNYSQTEAATTLAILRRG